MPASRIDYYFKIDPFIHKRISLAEKLEYCKRYSSLITKQLGKSRLDVVAASGSFYGRPQDLIRFFGSMSFWRITSKRELTRRATTLAVLSAVITAESMMLRSGGSDEDRFVKFLTKCFSEDDKKLFLRSFIFSQKQDFPVGASKTRHLVYRKVVRTHSYNSSEYCHANSQDNVGCECLNYINSLNGSELNKYFRKLASRLYKMRCSVVHDASAVSYCHTEQRPGGYAFWSYGVIDSYQLLGGKIVQYETALSRQQIENALKQAFWVAYKFGWPR